jgi:putative phosphonate metabolism protein
LSGPRYALYYAPAVDSALWRFGCATLGYDAFTGEEVAFAVPPGWEAQLWSDRTAEPRRYGFHATLKAPFELANGRSEGQLRAFARQIALSRTAVLLAGLKITALGRFVALVPSEPSRALQALAFDIVQAFEPFRAPLAQADRERRLASPLTPAERAYLEAYGYPYVGDAFRFHMTLTGALAPDQAPAVSAALAEAHARAVPAGPVSIDRLAVFRQDDRAGRFRIIDAFPLGR